MAEIVDSMQLRDAAREIRSAFIPLLGAGAEGAASSLISVAYGVPLRLQIDRRQQPLLVRWEVTRRGSYFIINGARSEFAGPHFLGFLPIVSAYHTSGVPLEGAVNISLEDHFLTYDGISFCDKGDAFLVPDPPFITFDGYAHTKGALAAHPVPWEEREKRAFWRGATTGRPDVDGDWRTLPRVKLCELLAGHGGIADAKINATAQWDGIDVPHLMGDTVPPHDWQRWRYQIDIDGNSNAWSGFYQRLLTGSPVLKVASSFGFRQWYYHRLQPWVHYVPVRSDMADLAERIAWLRENDGAAREIGSAGRRLALDMTREREVREAVPVVMAAIRCGR